VTGLRTKFFKNCSAWKVSLVGTGSEPYIALDNIIGRSRQQQVGGGALNEGGGPVTEFITATKKSYLHQYPSMLNSQSVRTLESQIHLQSINEFEK
jgi:hypothetical protein